MGQEPLPGAPEVWTSVRTGMKVQTQPGRPCHFRIEPIPDPFGHTVQMKNLWRDPTRWNLLHRCGFNGSGRSPDLKNPFPSIRLEQDRRGLAPAFPGEPERPDAPAPEEEQACSPASSEPTEPTWPTIRPFLANAAAVLDADPPVPQIASRAVVATARCPRFQASRADRGSPSRAVTSQTGLQTTNTSSAEG